MTQKDSSRIFNSAAYKTDAERVAATILLECSREGNSEATIASIFETQLYFFIKRTFEIDLKFKKEVGMGVLRHDFQGRMDAVANKVVIEYKSPKKFQKERDRSNAVSQAKNYLYQLSQYGEFISGVVTDGRNICFIDWVDNELCCSGIATINLFTLDKLLRMLIGSSLKVFSKENIIADFTLKDANNPTFSLSQELFNIVKNNCSSRTKMLFKEWLSLFHLSESDKGKNKDILQRRIILSKFFNTDLSENDSDYKALFALQTTYAIVIKLIACKAIGKIAYDKNIQYFSDLSDTSSNQLADFLRRVEDGYVFSLGGIYNLLEGDFFSWYSDEEQWCIDLYNPIVKIISQIESYSDFGYSANTTLDVFKDLYMDFIPVEVRHSLGEYYTPEWLAERIVDSVIEMNGSDSWRGVDPCCGSGVFVLQMAKKIIGKRTPEQLTDDEKRHLINEVVTRVAGIDINPLSALTARVNLYLSLAPYIPNGLEVVLPIYVGDSAITPKRVIIDDVECYTYSIHTSKKDINATLPVSFVESKSFISEMNLLQTFVKSGQFDIISMQLTKSVGLKKCGKNLKKAFDDFSKDLVFLHEQKWDGIWVRIVTNFMLVTQIGKRDIIVGNPPWVKWEYLPTQYAGKLKEACLSKKMFSGQSYMGAISLNICAAIAIMTASEWLTSNGISALLMPQNLLTQDSYEGFRNFYLNENCTDQLYLQFVEIWPKSAKIFGNKTLEPCATYYYSRNFIDYSNGVKAYRYSNKNLGKGELPLFLLDSWSSASNRFGVEDAIAIQLTNKRSGFSVVDNFRTYENLKLITGTCSYKGRTGVEFVPDEVTFLEFLNIIPNSSLCTFRNVKLNSARHKAKSYEPFNLETEFVRPLLTAPEIEDFRINKKKKFCLFPYLNNETVCVNQSTMLELAPSTLQYLLKNKDLYKKQSERSKGILRGSEFYALSKVGPYTFNENIVVLRDNTRMSAAVIESVLTPWGKRIMPIAAKHAPIISTRDDSNKTPITRDEAYYIAGIFNTPIVKKWFDVTFSSRSYSIAFNIYIPVFDSTNPHHCKIRDNSIIAHKMAKEGLDTNSIVKQIEDEYIEICKTKHMA